MAGRLFLDHRQQQPALIAGGYSGTTPACT
jgi:hypothetical protein